MSRAGTLWWIQWDKAGAVVARRFRDTDMVDSASPGPPLTLPAERIIKRGLPHRPKQDQLL